jgi:hypothetical protein
LATGGDAGDEVVEKKASKGLSLGGAADPDKLEEEYLDIGIPALANKGKVDLFRQASK